MKEIVFATNNSHKLREVREIVGEDIIIRSLSDIDCYDDIAETADTLAGNALIKARWIKEKYGYDCIADDTGLMVDVLGGSPGVHTARYAGDECDSKKNVEKLLSEMKDKENRKAHFSTFIAFIKGEKEYILEGRIDGFISEECRGTDGFGYDPVFMPEGYDTTFAEMSSESKNAISHRGRAMQKFLHLLKYVP